MREQWFALGLAIAIAVAPTAPAEAQLHSEKQAVAEDQEPLEQFEVQIDEQSISIPAGEERQLRIGNETKSLRVKKSPVKTLQVRHLAFDYPSSFHFDAVVAKRLGQFSKWDLKGRWVKLSLHRMTDTVTFDEYVANVSNEIEAEDGTRKVASVEEIQEDLGVIKPPGKELSVLVAPDGEVKIKYIDLLECKDGCRYVLIIANLSPGNDDQEQQRVLELLKKSLKLTSPTLTIDRDN
jgi:hypothetical protein